MRGNHRLTASISRLRKKQTKKDIPRLLDYFERQQKQETVHAHNHLRALKGIGDTTQNLEAAIAGETFEFKQMYPEMIEAAKAEGNKAAERTFNYANEVEKIHAQLYRKLLETLGSSQENYPYYVCPTCGYTAEGHPPGACPVCNVKGPLFKKID